MLDFRRQFAGIRAEILDSITEVCESQAFILGPRVASFEAAAAAACGVPYSVGCASGTDALWLMLAAAGLGDSHAIRGASEPQGAIVTTPFSFFATASCILRAGLRPVFADIDPRTFNLSPDSTAAVLASGKRRDILGILPVHLYGQCADWDGFEALQQMYPGMMLFEDAAQAFGATWNGRFAGSLGVAAGFSFYPTKNLAAMGDAGLVTTSDPEIARRAKKLRAHGMDRRYYHDEVGWNSRMDAMQAAVLQVKLRYLPEWNRRRQERAARYDELFRVAGLVAEGEPVSTKDGILLPWRDPRAGHVFHQYVIRVPRRDALRAWLTEREIGSEIYYPVPLHQQSALKELGYKVGDFPHAEAAAAEVLALPLFPELRDDEQETVVESIRRFYA